MKPPGFSSELPKNTAPHRYSLGERAHGAARKLRQQIWTGNQTHQEHAQISEVLAGVALPTLRSHAWAAFCLSSVSLRLATHPTPVWEGMCSWSWSICCPSPRSAEGSQHQQRWVVDGTGRSGRSRTCDQCSARREASDAKSILIMAIQGRSKIAFLILESADKKHPPC